MFDVQAFTDQAINEANSTSVVPVPVGDYTAIADKFEIRQWVNKEDPTKSGLALDVHWAIDDQAVKDLLGRDKVTVKQGIMLDLTEEGGLDMGKGKNVGLGKLRAALGLNNPGQSFSFNQIPGQIAKIKIGHTPNPKDAESPFVNVVMVAKA